MPNSFITNIPNQLSMPSNDEISNQRMHDKSNIDNSRSSNASSISHLEQDDLPPNPFIFSDLDKIWCRRLNILEKFDSSKDQNNSVPSCIDLSIPYQICSNQSQTQISLDNTESFPVERKTSDGVDGRCSIDAKADELSTNHLKMRNHENSEAIYSKEGNIDDDNNASIDPSTLSDITGKDMSGTDHIDFLKESIKDIMNGVEISKLKHHVSDLKNEVIQKENNDFEYNREPKDVKVIQKMCSVSNNDMNGSDGENRLWIQHKINTESCATRLCEQLRLILEPTLTTRLQGSHKTGKRINMRKVITYVASGFQRDKIWMRRTKPAKRNYQVMLDRKSVV